MQSLHNNVIFGHVLYKEQKPAFVQNKNKKKSPTNSSKSEYTTYLVEFVCN